MPHLKSHDRMPVRPRAERRAEAHTDGMEALTARFLRVQEEERRRLAQELHDQIGQLLTGLYFQIDAARQAVPGPILTEALKLTEDILRSVRELTLQLRPRILDDAGLRSALEWQAKIFQRRTGIRVELRIELPEGRLAPEIETTAFRIVQESLTNVARHSGADAVTVVVVAGESALRCEISDRGRGFDVAAALQRRESAGLTGLLERARLTGGRIEIVSAPGRGSRICAVLALGARRPKSP